MAHHSAKGPRHPAGLLPSIPCPSSSLRGAGQGCTARESQLTAHAGITSAAGQPPAPTQTLAKLMVMGTSTPGAPGEGGGPALPSPSPLISYITCPSLQARVIRLNFPLPPAPRESLLAQCPFLAQTGVGSDASHVVSTLQKERSALFFSNGLTIGTKTEA